LAYREERDCYRLYGQTAEGRYFFAVLEHIEGTVYKPTTARGMTDAEKRNYRRLMSLIQAENLTKVYGKGETTVTALDHIHLGVDARELVAVMGPSGCGKSTLLHLLGGLDRPTEGHVIIDGQPLDNLSDEALTKLRRQSIGFVFQFYNLIPVLNATENAALPILLDGISPAKAKARAREWLQKVGLGDRLNSRPDQLSGGQQQRVAVARALVAEPKLVLADEPTGNLDSRASDEIAALLRQVANEWGRAVVMVTHDPRIASYADRILFLKDGAIVDETRPEPRNANNADWVADKVRKIA
jgi:putative ABC transport system ATP-binding protein